MGSIKRIRVRTHFCDTLRARSFRSMGETGLRARPASHGIAPLVFGGRHLRNRGRGGFQTCILGASFSRRALAGPQHGARARKDTDDPIR